MLGFNTASGMRSHVTVSSVTEAVYVFTFQYRKRYEITCDVVIVYLSSPI